MIVGRVLGWLLFLAGLVLLGRDLLGWLDTHRLEPLSFRRLWLDLDPGASPGAAHAPERVWDIPAPARALGLAGAADPGFVLIALCRPRLEVRSPP